MMKLLLFCFLLFSITAGAAELSCRSDFDESSHYELKVGIQNDLLKGPVYFRYITEDGLDLEAKMDITEQAFKEGAFMRLAAKNKSMAVGLDATIKQNQYNGPLRVSFDLDNVDALELEAVCTIEH
jgi:hypothetical protein